MNERYNKTFDPNQFKTLGEEKQESETILRESQKPTWFKVNRDEFDELARDI